MTLIRILGSQFGEPIYITEVNRAEKIKSDAQVAMNKNADPCRIFFLRVAGEDGAPTQNFSKILELSETSGGIYG